MKFLEAEHGAALDVMRTIKRALDPDNRMNPGKMVPDSTDTLEGLDDGQTLLTAVALAACSSRPTAPPRASSATI